MFRIEMLPAAHGDCLWIEYGADHDVHRILIDGGPAHTYPLLRERILHLPADERQFELLVVTHIDCDHIDGVVRLLQDAEALKCRFKRIWFNGRPQLDEVPDPAGQPLGPQQGEYLSLVIGDYEKAVGHAVLNEGFPGEFVAIDPDAPDLPVVDDLHGGLKLTILSPTQERLLALKDDWDKALADANIESGDERRLRRRLEEAKTLRPLGDVLGETDEEGEEIPEMPASDDSDTDLALPDELGGDNDFGGDSSSANGSSIALLAEFDGQQFLLAGDAWPSVLEASIDRLVPADRKLALTAFKLPHHGSVGNVTESLLQRISCKHYLLSTSGAVFRHPHERAVEMLLTHHNGRGKPRLHFNYRSKTTEKWADADDQKAHRYVSFHPRGISLYF
ncbi:MAG: hypothetical protein WD928_11685 [Gammaproteobacteria bacterium]